MKNRNFNNCIIRMEGSLSHGITTRPYKCKNPDQWPGFFNKPNLVNFIEHSANFLSPQKIMRRALSTNSMVQI